MVAVLWFASAAAAQEDNRIALGISYTTRAAPSIDAQGSGGIGLAWRFGHSETGWGWTTGLGWFASAINQPVGGSATDIGELHVRPFMGGYGYTRVIGRAAWSTNLLGGFAWTTFHQSAAANDAYHDRLGARSLKIQASNTFALRPETKLTFDLSKKIGLSISTGYVIARPRVTIRNTLGEESRRIRADMLVVSVDALYKIF